MEPQTITIIVSEEENRQRIDKIISQHSEALSRSRVQQLIDLEQVTHNDFIIKSASHKVTAGSNIKVTIPPSVPSEMVAKDIPLDITYEDDDYLIINKPAGLTVHPGAGNYQDTLVNGLLFHCGNRLSGIGGVERPGIVHRLDKDTSGLMVVAKHDKAHHHLADQLRDRTLKRHYYAVCFGVPIPHAGTITTHIGRHPSHRTKMAVVDDNKGKIATTHYQVKEIFGQGHASLVECTLDTGRTHQIRVHLNHLGHALIGDQTYNTVRNIKFPDEINDFIKNFPRQALHAFKLGVEHPTKKHYIEYISELPEDLKTLLKTLKSL